MTYKEVEVKFLEIDEKAVSKKLKQLGAKDEGTDLLKETIFYDKGGIFKKEYKFARIRKSATKSFLAYKQHHSKGKDLKIVDNVNEVEFGVDNTNAARIFLEMLGLEAYRVQEKKRHSFLLGKVMIEVDTWPKIPAYLEMEGKSEKLPKTVAKKLGLSWKDAYFGSARDVIEKIYKIPVSDYRFFTFAKQT